MIRSRLKKIAIVAGAGAIATMGTLALNPFSASADPTVATTMTVTGPANLATGHAASFVAIITATPPVVKATGAITFTITGTDASSISCVSAPVMSGKGKAVCKVAAGSLLASAGPYSVTAAYSGDPTYVASSDTISQTVSPATAHVKLTVDAKPISGTASTFTATVTGGGGLLPTGNVVFTVAADGKTNCTPLVKNNSESLSPNAAPTPVAQAVCSLPAQWLKASKADPHPSWTVVATYGGDANFASGPMAKMTGTAKS
jgi:Big-like domain-containing protein